MDDVKAHLRAFILERFLPGEPPESLKNDTPLRALGILDSMGTLMMVELVEATYDLTIEAHETDEANFGSIDRIAALIERRSARR